VEEKLEELMDVFRHAADLSPDVELRYYVEDSDGRVQPYAEDGDNGVVVFHEYYQQAYNHCQELEESSSDSFMIKAALSGEAGTKHLEKLQPAQRGGETL
jgi:outer membrane protein W